MAFNTLPSTKTPNIEEMRRKMKERGAIPHANPILADAPESQKASSKPVSGKIGRKSPKIYTRHLSTYLSVEQEQELKDWCKANGMTPSIAIRLAIQRLIKE